MDFWKYVEIFVFTMLITMMTHGSYFWSIALVVSCIIIVMIFKSDFVDGILYIAFPLIKWTIIISIFVYLSKIVLTLVNLY